MLFSLGVLDSAPEKHISIHEDIADFSPQLRQESQFLITLVKSTYGQTVLLLIWAGFLFLYGIHQGDLYRTEGLRAIVGAEMFRSGDWVVPRLYGEPILTKPPLFYWCIAATGKIIGEVTAWSARLPSALAGCAAVLLVYLIMRRYYGTMWGLLAALALPCSFLWLDKGSSAEIDALLVMWVIAAWGCFLRVVEDPSSKAKLGWWIAALLCVAASVLTKWIGFLFFYAMAIPVLAWRKQLMELFRWPHLLAAVIGVGVVWLWLGSLIEELGWSYVWSALWKEGSPHVLPGETHKHWLMDVIEHPFKIMAICLPWSLFALYGMWKIFTSSFKRNSIMPAPMTLIEMSLVCWAVAGTFLMTIFSDHNTRQSFALVPAWTLLGLLQVRKWMSSSAFREPILTRTRTSWIAGCLLVWCLVKVCYVEILVPERYRKRPHLDDQAAVMYAFVPENAILYLQAVKDECLMFTYGRMVRRVGSWERWNESEAKVSPLAPNSQGEMIYCILTERERTDWLPLLRGRISREETLRDSQNEPLILVQLSSERSR